MKTINQTTLTPPNGKQLVIEVGERGFHIRADNERGKVLIDASLLEETGQIDIYTDSLQFTEHQHLIKILKNGRCDPESAREVI